MPVLEVNIKAIFSGSALVLLFATLVGGCNLPGTSDGAKDGMSLTLTSDRKNYLQGDSVQVTLTLRNSSKQARLVNVRMAANQRTAPDSVREVVFEITDPSGQIVPLVARINVRLPQETDFQSLAPGQSISRSHDLASLFTFDQAVTYSVHAVYHNSQEPPSGGDAWEGELESNTIRLTFE